MKIFTDVHNRNIRLTDERAAHILNDHPEMAEQLGRLKETLLFPDVIVQSRVDTSVELFYRLYSKTPVTQKYLCVVVKVIEGNFFIITAYYTDARKRGVILWLKK